MSDLENVPGLSCCEPVFNSIGLSTSDLTPLFRRCGITRVANLTGLDSVKFPVWSCIRPASRSLAVTFGKGSTDAEAQVTAIMEALENAFAETCSSRVALIASENDRISATERTIPLREMSRCDYGALDRNAPIRWIRGEELLTGEPVLAPLELVGLDYTDNQALPCFARASIGLAAHNCFSQAVLHAMLELLEHHATAQFDTFPGFPDFLPHLPPDQLPFAVMSALEAVDCRGFEPIFHLVPSIAETKTVMCAITDRRDEPGASFGKCWGVACRLNVEDAATAALFEAAQIRVTLIAGSREDLKERHYSRLPSRPIFQSESASWGDRPQQSALNAMGCAERLALRLGELGFGSPVVVKLTTDDEIIHVVRVLIPGLSCGLDRSRVLGVSAVELMLELPHLLRE